MIKIPFNKPHLTGNEVKYIYESVYSGKISGNGLFTNKCQEYFCQTYGFGRSLLTHSCTAALEMAAILIDVSPGDEIIIPSYTFVSTANAFVLRGAKISFVDSSALSPNLDAYQLESLITDNTKAIVPVHYAGVACDMEVIMDLAQKYNLFVIEDAAQAIDSYYKGKPLGTFGHFSAFSFHETKNIISGEGGLLAINDPNFEARAEIIWEKGTNRASFFRGEINKYGWVDIGSSYLPSEITAAFLYAQLEQLQTIQDRRQRLWEQYHEGFTFLEKEGHFKRPRIPDYATNNSHMYYIVVSSELIRSELITHLKRDGIWAVFHYLSLHSSQFYNQYYQGPDLKMSDYYSNCLLRLPLFYDLKEEDVALIIGSIHKFFQK